MALNLNALVDEFKRTNWQDPGTWHVAPQALVLLAILIAVPVAGFFADTQGQIEELEAGRNTEDLLKQQYLGKKKQAVNLDLHRQQLREIDTQFGALLKQLPNKSQMDALLVDINQAGLGRGLQFELFKPGQVVVRDYYVELPISVRLTGNYHDFASFTSDVANLPRIVTLHDVRIGTPERQPSGAGAVRPGGPLVMEATAKTFRYLDPEEVADPLAPENILKSSGRGIFFMRNFMDDVTLRRGDEGGMEVRMVKKLATGG